jgi:hypothetical protein
MTTTKDIIGEWFDIGLSKNAKYMSIHMDWFDYEDYPVYYESAAEFWGKNSGIKDKQMEVYDMSMDKNFQLNEFRAFHYPPLDSSNILPY